MINVSVIIPSYNHAEFLKERIESVLAQTYNFFELIILDDASSDNSREIIESYRQHPLVSRIIYSDKNSGSPYYQWQKGITIAKYDWVWIAESDDIALPIFLESAIKQLSENNKAVLYFCNSSIEIPGHPDKTSASFCQKILNLDIWQKRYSVNGIVEINRTLKYSSTIPNSSAVVFNKKELIKNLATLNKFSYCGDWYSYITILAKGDIIYNNEINNRFRRTSLSHSILRGEGKIVDIKTEYFRILYLLLKTPGVSNKKNLISWFTANYTGFGFRTEGFKVIIRIIMQYYKINFWLASRIILNRFLLKFSSKSN